MIYQKFLIKLSDIQPEYLIDNSHILLNKNKLFQISKNIVNTINKEINEINKYVITYSQNYFDKNLYDIHYNLYHFRKYFLNDE